MICNVRSAQNLGDGKPNACRRLAKFASSTTPSYLCSFTPLLAAQFRVLDWVDRQIRAGATLLMKENDIIFGLIPSVMIERVPALASSGSSTGSLLSYTSKRSPLWQSQMGYGLSILGSNSGSQFLFKWVASSLSAERVFFYLSSICLKHVACWSMLPKDLLLGLQSGVHSLQP